MKNRAQLPRTAGLRTLTELTTGLTKAGLDPSRIQERAEIIAKAQGAKRKRANDDDDAEMDVDDGGDGAEEDWMDVDGEGAPQKRAKVNSGKAVVKNPKVPRTDRQLAGMRDDTVSSHPIFWNGQDADVLCSKPQEQSSFATSGKENGITTQRLERPIVLSRPRWYVATCHFISRF